VLTTCSKRRVTVGRDTRMSPLFGRECGKPDLADRSGLAQRGIRSQLRAARPRWDVRPKRHAVRAEPEEISSQLYHRPVLLPQSRCGKLLLFQWIRAKAFGGSNPPAPARSSAAPEIADETGLAGELLHSSATHCCFTGVAQKWLSTSFAAKPSTIGGAERPARLSVS
jgi:hypothetical protein